MKFTNAEAEAVLRALDAGLKNIHTGGLNVIEGANIYVSKLTQDKQQEQQEQKERLDKQIAPPPG